MSRRAPDDAQADLFVPFVTDLPLRDQREMMERPFFSLSKRKRLQPIEYKSPKGDVFVNVTANPNFGMATIWDADVLIWAASTLQRRKNERVNHIPRTLSFHPFDLLRTIRRPTGGVDYQRLRAALGRLQSTTIVTNIGATSAKKHRQFSWIEGWDDVVDEQRALSRGMSLTLAEWFHERVLMDGGVLSLDPAYFSLTGGRERWLYRVARKHAGGSPDGFAIRLETLFEKSGAEGSFRRFKFEILRIAAADQLPGVALSIEDEADAPSLRMRLLGRDPEIAAAAPKAASARPAPLLRHLCEEDLGALKRVFPRLDIYAYQAEYDAWLDADPAREPKHYPSALSGWLKRLKPNAMSA